MCKIKLNITTYCTLADPVLICAIKMIHWLTIFALLFVCDDIDNMIIAY